jgi:hypothetical protein
MQGKSWPKDSQQPFENATQFKYLGMTVTNQNLIPEEIKEQIEFG